MYTTHSGVVAEQLPRFLDLLKKQFVGCGQKYRFDVGAEWTDVICAFVPRWVEGTILKYAGRYKQYRQERDLVKIATYAFILSIKHGLLGDYDALTDSEPYICTTVPVKLKLWPDFEQRLGTLADTLIHQREIIELPGPMSCFDVTRKFDSLSNLSQIIIHADQAIHAATPHRRAWSLASIAFLCFIQWVQDGHHLTPPQDDDPTDTDGVKQDAEEVCCASD